MYWHDEVAVKLKKKNQILFPKDCAFLQELSAMLQRASRRVVTLWALDLAEESAEQLATKYPRETRPAEAVLAARDWAAGRIKMPVAQRKILDCHALAKELECKADIAACHAIGQGCSVVHTAGHAMGYPMYDLTSIVHQYGFDGCIDAVEQRKRAYLDKLLYWNAHFHEYTEPWADFLLRLGIPCKHCFPKGENTF